MCRLMLLASFRPFTHQEIFCCSFLEAICCHVVFLLRHILAFAFLDTVRHQAKDILSFSVRAIVHNKYELYFVFVYNLNALAALCVLVYCAYSRCTTVLNFIVRTEKYCSRCDLQCAELHIEKACEFPVPYMNRKRHVTLNVCCQVEMR